MADATDKQPDLSRCAEAAAVCACFNFRKASRAVTQLFDEMLAPTGLRSTQFVVLVAINLHEPVGPAALARELVLDRSTLSRNLKPLIAEGLVRVRPNGQRAHVIGLTAKGKQRIGQALPLWEQAQGAFVEQLGPEKWATMLDDLRQAVQATRVR